MQYDWYTHRFADIILNSDYALKQEIEEVIQSISFVEVQKRFDRENKSRRLNGKKEAKGKQSTINAIFRDEFSGRDWELEKNVFNDPTNDLSIDF